jgi:hypothetical protein
MFIQYDAFCLSLVVCMNHSNQLVDLEASVTFVSVGLSRGFGALGLFC